MINHNTETTTPHTIVVIGNGMVGQRFCEKITEFDLQRQFRIVSFCEEPRAADDRVRLTSFFQHRDVNPLRLVKPDWYSRHAIELLVGDRACEIDRTAQVVRSATGREIPYDTVVLATGSYPFVPPIAGIDKPGVFVYRTIEDLEQIIDHAERSKSCAVIGGGLLGLEAAKAAHDLNLQTHVIEFAPQLMPRQLDDDGSELLVKHIEDLGVRVHLNTSTRMVHGERQVEAIEFADGSSLDVDMIIVSAGIRPRDELALSCGLHIADRGGVVINDHLQSSDPRIYAIGEVASHRGITYGLVAPGREMAETLARNLCGSEEQFTGSDVSTKLKLLGVDVASFGNHQAGPDRAVALAFADPFAGTYKKLLFSLDGTRLLGGMLVGDASEYGALSMLAKTNQPLPCPAQELIVGPRDNSGLGGVSGMPGDALICSCNNVAKSDLCQVIAERELTTVGQIKSCTQAGTGCGGCLPLLADLLEYKLQQSGKSLGTQLCEHFTYNRTELFAIVKTKQLRSFTEVIAECGSGNGCEICKPAIASILAGLWNGNVQEPEHQTLQDTNDRFLANMQRGGLYSVIPRVPGGEITPDQLSAIADTATKYGLYTKITGGQRIDLLGAQIQDLPDIWEQLIEAGLESGHAYGKALRTVKSCVGTAWCRYGVQDAVGFAIRVESRYKGIRSPHKVKMAVSGCTRECAEAQSKDVGLVATENGYNLYVCGNGGSKPRHADLLAADIDEDTAMTYVDRFLMYYISTADKLTRTSIWCEKLEGGIDHIRQVVVDDKLGVCGELEKMMQRLVGSYECEWSRVVNDPEQRKRFRQFVNTDETEPCIEIVSERGQPRPADWPNELVSLEQFHAHEQSQMAAESSDDLRADVRWVHVGSVDDFPIDGGATIKYGNSQIAVFNFSSRGAWYATQNMCPHKKAFVLSRGIVGNEGDVPKVACPLHKKTFSLESGQSLQNEDYRIRTFPVRIDQTHVYLELPPTHVLDTCLATKIGCQRASLCQTSPAAARAGVSAQPLPR
ncbi:MAG: nitrite reductase large subunit NirB [Planctomycetaceae bacterium]